VQDDVVAVGVGSIPNHDLYVPVLEGAGIPWVRLQAAGGGQVMSSPISFAINGGFILGYAAVAALADDRGFDRVVYFAPDIPTVTGAFDTLGRASFDAIGIEAEMFRIPLGTPDVSALVAAGMATSPDMLVLIADATLCQALLPTVELANTDDVPVVIGDTCLSPDVLEVIGEETVEGAYDFAAYVPGDGPEAALFEAVLEQYSSTTPSGNAASGFGAVLSIVRAVNQVAPAEVTAATVLDALRTAKDVPQPVTDGLTFSCDGQALPRLPALCSTEVVLATVRDGVPADSEVVDAADYLG
jgi:branched-chain amino acid transport system substrate-binding protein